MATPTIPKAEPIFDKLRAINEQREAEKERGSEVRANGKALLTMATKLESLQSTIEELGGSGSVTDVIASLQGWADIVAPNVSVTWNREEVAADVETLEALKVLNVLTPDQVVELDTLKATLKGGGGSGIRSPRTPAERIEGRPERVYASAKGVQFSDQVGNVANSGPNLKTAAVNFFKKNGVEVSDEDAKGLLAAAKEVTEGRSAMEEYQGVTFSVAPVA